VYKEGYATVSSENGKKKKHSIKTAPQYNRKS
jgi:hypothetical protein